VKRNGSRRPETASRVPRPLGYCGWNAGDLAPIRIPPLTARTACPAIAALYIGAFLPVSLRTEHWESGTGVPDAAVASVNGVVIIPRNFARLGRANTQQPGVDLSDVFILATRYDAPQKPGTDPRCLRSLIAFSFVSGVLPGD
jgi:hypothetical protein